MITALLAEGTSDKALLPVLRWVLACASPVEAQVEWIDTASIERRGRTLDDKVRAARIVCRCDLLFVHRDADNMAPQRRHEEIRQAVGDQPHVAVVPVRTTEAWLLFDERAIREASGRVSGVNDLGLPPLAAIEGEPEPKELLHTALKRAHGATGRRAQRFHPPTAVHHLAGLIEDWTPLRTLPAFRRLESDTRRALESLRYPLYP